MFAGKSLEWNQNIKGLIEMKPPRFIGREAELAQLNGLLKKNSASFIVIRGRRRIGKSRLLAEFGKNMKSFFFSGIPPTPQTTIQSQRVEFSYQLARFGLPGINPDDWGTLFWHLSKETAHGKVLIVLDEISWMGNKDPDFLGKLKTAWDLHFSKNPQLLLVLCGSISSWIEENILSSTGFVGRINLDLEIEELPLKACNGFWSPKEGRISAYEKFKILSITGGVPLYLEQIRTDIPAEANIHNLCFTKGGLLVREFDDIFSDLFSRRNLIYKEIVKSLIESSTELTKITEKIDKNLGGTYSHYLNDLIKAGFVKRDFTWSIGNDHESKLSHYRLSDNYLRFYLKYILPNRSKIDRGFFSSLTTVKLPGWESIMGLQFENLVVHNRSTLWELLNLSPQEIIMDGPFFQNPTTRQQGCQIDYLIQTRFQTLYVCEVKFHKHPIGMGIITEMEEKRKRLKIPKYSSIRPILIHVNGVDEQVIDADYFDQIIDFASFLK
jgi:AAA+ ATPase superfamily predicted ATPase